MRGTTIVKQIKFEETLGELEATVLRDNQGQNI